MLQEEIFLKGFFKILNFNANFFTNSLNLKIIFLSTIFMLFQLMFVTFSIIKTFSKFYVLILTFILKILDFKFSILSHSLSRIELFILRVCIIFYSTNTYVFYRREIFSFEIFQKFNIAKFYCTRIEYFAQVKHFFFV